MRAYDQKDDKTGQKKSSVIPSSLICSGVQEALGLGPERVTQLLPETQFLLQNDGGDSVLSGSSRSITRRH